jgi:hypothetical protein
LREVRTTAARIGRIINIVTATQISIFIRLFAQGTGFAFAGIVAEGFIGATRCDFASAPQLVQNF